MPSNTRLSINISEETARQLRELAESKDTSVTNIVRRAVGIYKFLDDEIDGTGKNIQIIDRDKKETTTLAII